jgi:diguanylate cyclase (GGDEF)-like protein
MAIVVVSDITAMKQAEYSLRTIADHMKSLAETDGLTGAVNRRAFDDSIVAELARSIRNRTSLSVMMIDIDRFKLYNDTYGHLAGDQCLKAVSDCLRDVVRGEGNIVARFGGEEFVVLLPETEEVAALERPAPAAFRKRVRPRDRKHRDRNKKRLRAGTDCISTLERCRPSALSRKTKRTRSNCRVGECGGRREIRQLIDRRGEAPPGASIEGC